MDSPYLYQQIAEALRQDILAERIKPGERLPSLRAMTSRWGCTPGTIQRAYRELARQGLVTSRPGQGTHVTGALSTREETPLRRAELVHRAEAFLLEAISSGYEPEEIETAVRTALDRWRSLLAEPRPVSHDRLRFNGSHDPALTWVAEHFHQQRPQYAIELAFSGSLGGLIALAEGRCDIAGCHLWDEESSSYNAPYVRRILPGKRIALVHFAERRLGLILGAGNPLGIHHLIDLARSDVRFVNRQPGSGTRVWLDGALKRLGIPHEEIAGYEIEKLSHSEVARAVTEGKANAGFGLETSARVYGLDFILLTQETYHLVLLASMLEHPAVQALLEWLVIPQVKAAIAGMGGYDTAHCGEIEILST